MLKKVLVVYFISYSSPHLWRLHTVRYVRFVYSLYFVQGQYLLPTSHGVRQVSDDVVSLQFP